MAHIRRYRTSNGGERWRVMFRIDKRLVSEQFTNANGAAEFAALVDRVGGKVAREVLATRRGSKKAGKIPTVAQALEQHIDALTGITEGTRRDYRKMATRIGKSALGPLPVDVVTETAVGKWVDSQSGKVSAKTIRNRHGLLFAAMRSQVKAGVIGTNPCEETKVGESEHAEMTILSAGELVAVLDQMDEHWRPFVITLAGTGLRFGEATALQVRDVDLSHEPPLLRVSRSWKHTDSADRELGPPKTKKGRRPVSLPPEVAAAIAPLLDGKDREDFVFVNKAGQPIRQNSFHEIWSRALDDADIGKRPRIHDLRHSHVASLIASGVPLPVIQRRLGHNSITTTVDVYGGLAEDALSIAAQAASVLLSPALPELEA